MTIFKSTDMLDIDKDDFIALSLHQLALRYSHTKNGK